MVDKAPEGYHVVRRHFRRNPRPKGRKLSGWMIAGLVAVVWLWGQVFGFGESASGSTPAPGPSATMSTPAPAGR
ncbi:hypothetical protein [Streptomyces sp. NPDC058964]|uniref:hypothetical protein n=1 Tax=Streptomyces sp. NPDC058964 TaxID=3346681 RepID=UPI0036A384A9